MERAIDAEKLLEQLQKKTAGPANKRYTEGFNDCLMRVRSMVHSAPTLTPPNEWVSVEDAVPDPGVRVLAANGSFVGEAYMASNGAWMRHDGFPWKVDHWMPMPDRRPPEGESDA